MDFNFLSQGVVPQLPNPLALTTQAMTLAQLAARNQYLQTQTAQDQYNLASKAAQDRAMPAIYASNFDPAVVNAQASDPANAVGAAGILATADARRSSEAALRKTLADAALAQSQGLEHAVKAADDQLTLYAHFASQIQSKAMAGQPIGQDDLDFLNMKATQLGLPPGPKDVSDQAGIVNYLNNTAAPLMDPTKRADIALKVAQTSLAQTQTALEPVNAATKQLDAEIAAAKIPIEIAGADPLGIRGLQVQIPQRASWGVPGGIPPGGATSVPGATPAPQQSAVPPLPPGGSSWQVPPQVQAQRDAMAQDLIAKEQYTNPANPAAGDDIDQGGGWNPAGIPPTQAASPRAPGMPAQPQPAPTTPATPLRPGGPLPPDQLTAARANFQNIISKVPPAVAVQAHQIAMSLLAGDNSAMTAVSLRGKQGQDIGELASMEERLIQGELGLTANDLMAMKAANVANKAALVNRTEALAAINQASDALANQAQAVRQYIGTGTAPTPSPIINRWIQAGRQSIAGDPDVTQFNILVNAMTREHQRLVTAAQSAGQLHVTTQNQADQLLNTSMNPAQIASALNAMIQDGANLKQAAVGEVQRLHNALASNTPDAYITGNTGAGASTGTAAAPPPPKLGDRVTMNGQDWIYKGGDPASPSSWDKP